MLKTISQLEGLTVHASDGEIGSIKECYFNDERWNVRYLVVDVGSWIVGRSVLISPVFVEPVDWNANTMQIRLTKKQIESSAPMDTHKPVSRQHEANLIDCYGGFYDWGGSSVWGIGPPPVAMAKMGASGITMAERKPSESHLQSSRAVTGYQLEAADGDIGHVHGFLLDPQSWSIRYLDVDTRNWLPEKRVLISPEWVVEISWPDSKTRVGLTREAIKTAPEFSEGKVVTKEFERAMHDHFGRPHYCHEGADKN